MIYLDNNATTLLDPRVAEAMLAVWQSGPMNPSSQHAAGRRARVLLDDAVSELGQLLGTRCDRPGDSRLILTSGGTEANNLALGGIGDPQAPLVVSCIEHASVLEVAKAAENAGRTVHWLPVDAAGVVSLETLERILQTPEAGGSALGGSALGGEARRPALVSLMAANNETGVLQPVADAASICRTAGVPLHVDATQMIGKLPFSFDRLGIDAMTFAAHKFHGPTGIGGLLLREPVPFQTAWHGGAQQLGQRPGTEAVALAVGAATALRLAVRPSDASAKDSEPLRKPNIRPRSGTDSSLSPRAAGERGRVKGFPERLSGSSPDEPAGPASESMRRLRDRFESRLRQQIPDLVIHGQQAERLPNTSCIGFPGTNRQSMLMALDFAGIACSSGSACASGSSQPSYVLQAMGIAEELVDASLRFGLSRFSTEQEVDESADAISKSYKKLRKR